MSQPARLLNYLERHGSITRLEAARELGIMNLWSRVSDLERLGCVVRREDGVKVPDRFGKQCAVTRYTLICGPEQVAALTNHPRVIGIGESGLDYFYDRSPRDVQQAGFRAHIRAARLAGLPLAIHARDADDDIAAILQDERDSGGDFSFLLHCFSSSRALAEAAIRMGGYVSFSGILTFPRSNELREIARDLPAESTDRPARAIRAGSVPVAARIDPAAPATTPAVLMSLRPESAKPAI